MMAPTASVERLQSIAMAIEREVARVIVGQETIVRGVLISLLAGGHTLLEGVPGLGKTLLVRTLANVLDLRYSRIQFTPDLMPADILGTNVLLETESGERQFRFQSGPVFANLVLADEINRAAPKTQSALLEAMQEHTVTLGSQSYDLPRPFFVLATQNPIELEGTYPLPEAQLDRFFFKLQVEYPSRDQLTEILVRTTSNQVVEVETVADAQALLQLQHLAREVPIASHVMDYIVRLVMATHAEQAEAHQMVRNFVRYGGSPRAAQALVLASKINALLSGRFNASFQDVRRVARAALRHRIILNVEAEVNGVQPDAVIDALLKHVPEELRA
ncbi:MAG: MoxR family ATPase [Chloroflexi bacterium]|nr:MoxR family ATPase [Chloroflexota bacterium]